MGSKTTVVALCATATAGWLVARWWHRARSKDTPAFGDRLVELLNAHATSTALGVASRTGLLVALRDAGAVPAAAADLAARAGMKARYVQEILAVLVTGGVVRLQTSGPEGGEDMFALLPERAEALKVLLPGLQTPDIHSPHSPACRLRQR